jgi:hypothetical protein
MKRLVLSMPFLLLAGCMGPEPLAPPFAGQWASAVGGCKGPRITINKSGISASGMPVDGLTFTQVKVSGATADLVMELSPAARLATTASLGPRKGEQVRPEDLEVSATLIANPSRVHPTNVIVRNKKTRQLQAADPGVLAIMTLMRCKDDRTS